MQGKVPRVVVVGGAYVDIAIRCGQIPSAGRQVAGSALSYAVTGPGPNQAVEAALCGCNVHLISKIGGDPFGRMVTEVLADFKVNTDFVRTAEAKNTGAVVTMVAATGENTGLVYTGANGALLPQDIDAAEQIFSQADVCLIHGQLPQDAIIRAIRCAKLYGTKVILNPARPMDSPGRSQAQPRQSGRQDDSLPVAELPVEYFSVNILIPNLGEAADITDQSAAGIHTAKLIGSDLVARGADSAVITMGRRGCMVVDRNGADHIPAFEIELIDQTGRGDAFAGALAACFAVKEDVREAVKFASAAGALACTKFGSIEALPTRAEIIELLQKEDTG